MTAPVLVTHGPLSSEEQKVALVPSRALAPGRQRIYQARGAGSCAVAERVLVLVVELPVTPTIRQVFYILVSDALIPKTEKAYKSLVKQLGRMRKGGVLAYDAFIDGTRERRTVQTFAAPSEVLAYNTSIYRKDLWARQPVVPEVWAEADTLAQMLWQVAGPLGVACVVTRGNSSLSQMYASAAVIAQRWARGQSTHIVYVGDFDSAGMDMSDNLHRRLVQVGAPPEAISVQRVAMTKELMEAYHLPPHEPKQKDSRTPAFVARSGVECVEVEALPPAILAEVVEDTGYATIADSAAWDEAVAQQQIDRRKLRILAEQAGPMVDAWDVDAGEED